MSVSIREMVDLRALENHHVANVNAALAPLGARMFASAANAPRISYTFQHGTWVSEPAYVNSPLDVTVEHWVDLYRDLYQKRPGSPSPRMATFKRILPN